MVVVAIVVLSLVITGTHESVAVLVQIWDRPEIVPLPFKGSAWAGQWPNSWPYYPPPPEIRKYFYLNDAGSRQPRWNL